MAPNLFSKVPLAQPRAMIEVIFFYFIVLLVAIFVGLPLPYFLSNVLPSYKKESQRSRLRLGAPRSMNFFFIKALLFYLFFWKNSAKSYFSENCLAIVS